MEVYSKEKSVRDKISTLQDLDGRLAEYRADVAAAIEELSKHDKVTEDVDLKVSDLCVGLAYDADDLDDAFHVGYAAGKSKAIISVAGVAALLGDLVSKDTSVNVSAGQMKQLSSVLMDAARNLDGLANRSTLLCG